MRILVVEDDPGIGELVRDELSDNGYAVDWVTDGAEALGLLGSFPYDLVVLDVMLPGHDGFTVTERLRRRGSEVPVLILTARDALDDRVRGLELGADDYLVKPFHLSEFRARVRALLRRAYHPGGNRIEVSRVVIDSGQRRAWFEGEELSLSGREYALLEFLALHPGAYFPREALVEHVWSGEASVDPRTVDTYIHYLRRKLGDDVVQTVRGLGYRFNG